MLDFVSAAALVVWVALILVLAFAVYEAARLLFKRRVTKWDRLIALIALLGILLFLLTRISG